MAAVVEAQPHVGTNSPVFEDGAASPYSDGDDLAARIPAAAAPTKSGSYWSVEERAKLKQSVVEHQVIHCHVAVVAHWVQQFAHCPARRSSTGAQSRSSSGAARRPAATGGKTMRPSSPKTRS